MKALVFAIVAVASGCSAPGRATSQQTTTLSIVGTNDLHGGVLADNGRGGLALLDGYLRNLRAARTRDGGAVLLLDAGDLFQGTLESNLNEGAVVISAYNALGYAASAVGNHEFDFGPVGEATVPRSAADDPRGALKARTGEARFPFLAANVIEQSTGRPVDWPNVKPSTIVDIAGIHVGLVGLSTLETLSTTMPANTRGLAVVPLAPTLEAEATRLRRAGATIVVAAAHAGGRCTKFDNPSDLSSCRPDAEIFEVARALPPGLVDVIVAGHQHEGLAHEVAGVAIISSYTGGRAFGRVDLVVDRASGRVQSRHIFPPHDICAKEDPGSATCVSSTEETAVAAKYEGQPVTASAEIEAILAPAVAAARSLKEKPLNAVIEDRLTDPSSEESALGNLLADWTRAVEPRADAAIVNGGGLRAPLPPGPLTYGRLYELTPFDNREVVITLRGAELETVVKSNLEQHGSIILLSGVRATATCDGGELRVSLQRSSGKRIRGDESLTIVTTDFLATGGDDFLTPVMPLRVPVAVDGPLVRDEIVRWLTRTGGDWRAADLLGPANRRLMYPGSRPVTCR